MKRELVPTMIRTEFGDVLDSPEFYETMGQAQDHTYVEGYSDLRRARDIAIRAAMRARTVTIDKNGEQALSAPDFRNVPALPVRLQWARTSAVKSGQPDNAKEVEFGSQNYRFVTKDDVGQPWCKSMPAGASWQADGSLKKGDTTLMVCDAKNAARNAATNRKAIERMHKDTIGATMHSQGADFTYESETADHQIAAPPPRTK